MKRHRALTAILVIAAVVLIARLLIPPLLGDGPKGPEEPAADAAHPAAAASAPPQPADPAPPVPRVARDDAAAGKPAQAASPLDPERDLRGIVVDEDGRPVAGAWLRALHRLDRFASVIAPVRETVEMTAGEAVTGDDGRFRMRLSPRGPVDLEVSAGGYGTKRLLGIPTGQELRIVLARAATIRGRVTDDASGAPVAGAHVILHEGVLGGTGSADRHTTTDERGRYAFDDLPATYVQLRFHHDEHVSHWDSAYSLRPGQQVRCDVALERGRVIRGRIFDANTEQPIAGARVRYRIPYGRDGAVTDEHGHYELRGVPPDSHERIHAMAPGYGRYDYTVTEVPPEGLELDLGLLPGRSLTGRVVDPDGAPIAGAIVVADAEWRRPKYHDLQTDRLRARSGADGRFTVEDLRVDLRHTLIVAARGFAVAVRDLPAAEWEGDALDVGDVVLQPPASIAGRVVDLYDEPVPGVWVQLRGEPYRRDELGPASNGPGYTFGKGFGAGPVMAKTGADGRYVLGGLPAGEYQVWIHAKGLGSMTSRNLILEEGDRVEGYNFIYEIEPSIRGVVVDEDGRPLPGASVSLEWPQNGRRVTYDLARADGSFRLGGLEPGAYRLVVDSGFHHGLGADGRRRRFGEVRRDDVVAGTDSLRIVLPEAYETSGVVIGPDGEPVPHAFLYRKMDGHYLWVTQADDRGRFTLWRALNDGFSLRCYPGGRNPQNQWAWRLGEDGLADLSYEHVVPDVAAGARDLVVRLPKVPPKD